MLFDVQHFTGHSLGSQLTGFIGKAFYKLTGKKIGRITALDPAGPAFDNSEVNCDSRLCENDAEFVDVIHTDIQLYGYTSPMGHVDFYPNGGRHQPGCPSREVDGKIINPSQTQNDKITSRKNPIRSIWDEILAD